MIFILKIRVEPGQTWRTIAAVLIDLGRSLRRYKLAHVSAPDGAAITRDPGGSLLGAWEVREDG